MVTLVDKKTTLCNAYLKSLSAILNVSPLVGQLAKATATKIILNPTNSTFVRWVATCPVYVKRLKNNVTIRRQTHQKITSENK